MLTQEQKDKGLLLLKKVNRKHVIDSYEGKVTPLLFNFGDIPDNMIAIINSLARIGSLSGSVVLYSLGLIKRIPSDIDLILSDSEYRYLKKSIIRILTENPYYNDSSYGRLLINGYKVDLLKHNKEMNFKIINNFKIHNYVEILEWKLNRASDKDIVDFKYAIEKLDNKHLIKNRI